MLNPSRIPLGLSGQAIPGPGLVLVGWTLVVVAAIFRLPRIVGEEGMA